MTISDDKTRPLKSAFEAEYPHLKLVYTFQRSVWERRNRPVFIQILRSMMMQLSGRGNVHDKRGNLGQVKEIFAEIFSCPYSQDIVDLADDELAIIRDLIAEFLRMIGRLARQIHSCEMQRILRLIVATKGKPWRGESVSREEADYLANEIAYCFNAIKSEVTLLSPEERIQLCYPRVWHSRPDHDIYFELPKGFSPEDKTKWHRNLAYSRFKDEYSVLMPSAGFNCEVVDLVKETENGVNELAKALRGDHPTLDSGKDRFDYKTLGDILSADLRLYYDRYYMEKEFDEDTRKYIEYEDTVAVIEETEQQKSKNRIVEDLRSILRDAIRLASQCGSKSGDLWLQAQVLFEKRGGDFHSSSEEDDDYAEVDLRDFLCAFRSARLKLWADWKRHERKDIKEKALQTMPQGPSMDAIRKPLAKLAGQIEKEGNMDKVDKRTPAQRAQINEVAFAAIRAAKIDHIDFNLKGKSDRVFRAWQSQGKQGGFPTAEKLREAVRYDLDHHYDWKIEAQKMLADDKNRPK